MTTALIQAPIPSSVGELVNIDVTALRARQVGFQVLLLNLAQREAERVKKLTAYLDILEEHLFDENVIHALSPSELAQLHQLASNCVNSGVSFISQTNKEINLDELHNKILILQNTAGDESISIEDFSSVAESARELLKQFTPGN